MDTRPDDCRVQSHLSFLLSVRPGGHAWRRVLGTVLSPPQEVAELIRQHKALMTRVLEDPLLVTLRLDGGTVLARLRKEEHGTSEDGR